MMDYVELYAEQIELDSLLVSGQECSQLSSVSEPATDPLILCPTSYPQNHVSQHPRHGRWTSFLTPTTTTIQNRANREST